MTVKEFVVMVVVRGRDEASPELLKTCVEILLHRARRFSPDNRFDWQSFDVIVDYQPDSHNKR